MFQEDCKKTLQLTVLSVLECFAYLHERRFFFLERDGNLENKWNKKKRYKTINYTAQAGN